MNDILVWIEALKTVRFLAEKSKEVGLTNIEVGLYCKLLSTTEQYFDTMGDCLTLSSKEIKQKVEDLLNDDLGNSSEGKS